MFAPHFAAVNIRCPSPRDVSLPVLNHTAPQRGARAPPLDGGIEEVEDAPVVPIPDRREFR